MLEQLTTTMVGTAPSTGSSTTVQVEGFSYDLQDLVTLPLLRSAPEHIGEQRIHLPG